MDNSKPEINSHPYLQDWLKGQIKKKYKQSPVFGMCNINASQHIILALIKYCNHLQVGLPQLAMAIEILDNYILNLFTLAKKYSQDNSDRYNHLTEKAIVQTTSNTLLGVINLAFKIEGSPNKDVYDKPKKSSINFTENVILKTLHFSLPQQSRYHNIELLVHLIAEKLNIAPISNDFFDPVFKLFLLRFKDVVTNMIILDEDAVFNSEYRNTLIENHLFIDCSIALTAYTFNGYVEGITRRKIIKYLSVIATVPPIHIDLLRSILTKFLLEKYK